MLICRLFSALIVTMMVLSSFISKSQPLPFLDFTRPIACSPSVVILLDGKVCGAPYFDQDKPLMVQGMEGTFTLGVVSKEDTTEQAIDYTIKFQVAIKKARTNTTWIYTPQNKSEVSVRDLLRNCEEGDSLIFMPAGQLYKLSNNEMKVAVGC